LLSFFELFYGLLEGQDVRVGFLLALFVVGCGVDLDHKQRDLVHQIGLVLLKRCGLSVFESDLIFEEFDMALEALNFMIFG
jgi:hypothetical protein